MLYFAKKKANISKVLVLIHSPHTGPRLHYILNYVLKERLGLDYRFAGTEDHTGNGLVICYSEEAVAGGLHIKPLGLLNETGTAARTDEAELCKPYNKITDTSLSQAYPDVFSAIFYHLSRYEEYLAPADLHGRFDHRSSCLFRHGLLNTPVADVWIERFRQDLERFSGLKLPASSVFRVDAGVDIDSVFAYKGKHAFRQAAAFAKDALSGRSGECLKRLRVLSGKTRDPNDNFELQQQIFGKLKATYFIQVGPYGRFDKNVDPGNPDFQKIIRTLSANGHTIALHPSYGSDSRRNNIMAEKTILESIIKQPVEHSRQHFLRFRLPETYRALIACGIKHEHSMGYSEASGFRAGTAFPFPWYDLQAEAVTTLTVHPFAVMDVCYKHFMHMNVEDAMQVSSEIIAQCKAQNAPFAFVFHNESLSGHRGWENWDKVLSHWCNG